MRRFAGHLFTILSAISLLLCVTMGVLWVRSWFAFDEIVQVAWNSSTARHVQRTIAWDRGRLFVVYRSMDLPGGRTYAEFRLPAPMWRHRVIANNSSEYAFAWWEVEFAGPGVGRGAASGVFDRSYNVALVFWPLILLTAVLPAVRLRRIWRDRRRARMGANLCVTCGYDLRASPERCPECGMMMKVPSEFRE